MKIQSFGISTDFTRKNQKNIQIYSTKDINSENHFQIIGEVNAENNNTEDETTCFVKQEFKRYNLPYILYVLFFTFVLFIASIIVLVIISHKKKIYYDFEKDIYIKPKISGHNYSRMSFENGLEIVFTQVHTKDTAGGAISFERGYLDLKYDPGFLRLAFLSMKYNNDMETSTHLADYIGTLNQACEEFYSTGYFTILNSGFRTYLKNFKNYTSYAVDDFNETIKRNLQKMNSFSDNVEQREKYLVEYLVYDIKDENGWDINRQGVGGDVQKRLGGNYTKIKEIMQELFVPKKIKLVFFSHYKMSLMRKFVLRYLHELTTNNKTLNESEKYFEKINTKKIIFHLINDSENNYIKISFYVKKANATLSQLYYDSGYFNYIKYILGETNEDSLYYNLTHPKNNKTGINIKSLSCDFDVVLQNRIRFNILIGLNHYSYNNIKEIIETVYEYIEKIKTHINLMKSDDERVGELFFINRQNFSFTEDVHSGEFYKNKAKDLFYRDDINNYLKENWLPSDLNETNENIKFYTEQLTLENSVVIIRLNNYTINKYKLNETNNDIAFIFNNLQKTNFSSIIYTINDLDKLKIKIKGNNISSSLIFHKNNFISNYSSEYEVKKNENNEEKTESKYTLINDTNDLVKFYYLKDTSFQLPKVFLIFYFFHPYLRPNTTRLEDSQIIFYHLMLYLSYIQREIDLTLADAKKAGNTFKLGYVENYIYLDISVYSDIAEKIVDKIKEIVLSINYETFANNYYIYKDYTLDKFLNNYKASMNNILKYEFYRYISIDDGGGFPPVYNFYKFPTQDFLDFNEINQTYINNIIFPIVHVYILGYYEKEDAEKLFISYNNSNFTRTHFISTLDSAQYNTAIDGKNFVTKSIFRQNLTEIRNISDFKEIKSNRKFLFMSFVQFSDYNRIPVDIFKKIIEEFNKEKIYLEVMNQKIIYLRISFDKKYEFNEVKKIMMETLRNSTYNMTEPLDVVGNRYYYLARNYENEYTKTPNDMENAAVQFSYNQLYNRTEVFNYYVNTDDFKEFIDTIKYFFEQNEIYCQFYNNK